MALYETLGRAQHLVRIPVNRNASVVTYYAALCQHQRILRRWAMFFILNFILFFWALLRAAGL
jgi:hypothetical protein